jgi:sulfite exporter TauE/SafE
MNEKKKVERLTFIIMALMFALLALGIAGSGDYQEAQDQAEFYDEMVCKGLWGDYRNRKPVCSEADSVHR